MPRLSVTNAESARPTVILRCRAEGLHPHVDEMRPLCACPSRSQSPAAETPNGGCRQRRPISLQAFISPHLGDLQRLLLNRRDVPEGQAGFGDSSAWRSAPRVGP